jgi:molecular chaperone DnaK
VDLRNDAMALQRLKEAAEKAKIELSSSTTTTVNLPFITATDEGPKHLNMDITRAQFEELIRDLVERTIEPMKKAMSDAGYDKDDITQVIMVGGSTRVPLVQETVTNFFGRDPNRSVNPDEVVSLGAAVQGGVLSGDVEDVVLLDVTPLGLGIETLGGVMSELISANTTIPTKKSEVYSTASDNQTSVEVHVLQGDREMARDNRTIGKFHLDGIPPAPRGTPQIQVTFDIDADGILNVSAVDKATGKEQSIRIEASSGLTDQEIEKMRSDAEAHAEEDKQRRKNAEKINEANALVYSTERNLDEYGDKISENKRTEITDAVARLKEVLDGITADDDIGPLDRALKDLNEKWNEASQEIYQAQQEAQQQTGAQGQQAPSGNGAAAEGDEDIRDADFEVVDEEEK